MTSLAHQLKRLALPQNDASLLSRSEVASLLFDPKDAATMDRSTFYALGCTGLEELLGIEPALQEFQSSLFSAASVTLERSVQSKDVNEKLDANISLFLSRLSPYFLLKPAHKCIEWLVHRFHIQLYNMDSLLGCALPYHDTNVFVRVLQMLNIKDNNRWSWLRCLQKPGVPLSRGALITHCYSDLSFMEFICSLVTKSIQAYSGHSGNCSQLRVIFSFYASTIIPALDAVEKVSEPMISKLLPYVQKGLKSPLSDYKAASYMLVCQLAVKVVLQQSAVETLALHISRSLLRPPLLLQEGLACLTVLLQSQGAGMSAGPRVLGQLLQVEGLVSGLQQLAVSHDVGPLLRYLLAPLVVHLFTGSPEPQEEQQKEQKEQQEEQEQQKEQQEQLSLSSLLQAVPLSRGLDTTVARLLLDQYLKQGHLSSQETTALDQRLLPVVRLLESRYCAALDSVLADHVTDISDDEQKRLFHQFLSLSLSSGKFQIVGSSDSSLLLSLKHPQPSVRVSALDHLVGLVSTGQQSLDAVFLRDVVAERLQDDVPAVAAAALRLLEVLLDTMEPEDVVSSLMTLLLRAEDRAQSWLPVLTDAVRLLSDLRLGKMDAELQQKTGWKLLPLLVLSCSELQLCVSRCPLLSQHPLTQGWSHELDQVMEQSSQQDFGDLVNARLVSTLTRNLANMEDFSRRDALERLVQVLELQRGGSTSFLLLVKVLLHGLEQLSETQHLLMAQRVYALLEKPLLEVGGDPAGSWSELLLLLRDFLSVLRRPEGSLTGEVWWNPERLDTTTCCYLSLLCRVFGLVVGGAAEGPTAGGFRDVMKLLVQVHLPQPLMLFRFLCVLWGFGGNHGDQLDLRVGAVLQTQALCVGGALLSSQSAATLEQLASAQSPVVPSLLCCLTSPVREVRRAALFALSSLSAASSSPYQPITERLLKTSEEILADPSYLSQVLCVLHDEGLKLQQLLCCVQDPCCPSYMAASLLRALGLVHGQEVLSSLLPVLERLLQLSEEDAPSLLRDEEQLLRLVLGKFTEAAAPLLVAEQTCSQLFFRALRTPGGHQLAALDQVSRAFFSSLSSADVQQQLLSVLFDLLQQSGPQVAAAVTSVFKGLSVDAQLLANELAPPERAAASSTVQQSRRSRISLRKQKESGEPCPEGGAVPWQRVTLILELLQHKKKLKRAEALVPVLFSLLARSLEPAWQPKGPEQTWQPGNMEYTKQLLLSCLLNVCHRLPPAGGATGADVLEEDKFNVELVVQVIRTSDTPQTHHQALLLLGTAASIYPEKVLHNIMPIFTFMGSNIMRLDDAYSFRVIDRTVQMVVPALIQAQQAGGPAPGSDPGPSPQLVAVVTRIVHVFADALPHVPEHRRLPVLTQLLATLGPAHFLWVLLLLLVKLHVTGGGASGDKDAAQETQVEFWISLCCHFEVSDQLNALISILDFLLQLPDDKDDAAAPRPAARRGTRSRKEEQEQQQQEEEEMIFSVERHSSKELRHFKFLTVSLSAQLLAAPSFIRKVADAGDEASQALQPLQQRLLEQVLRYIHSVARCVEENSDKPNNKFWRVLLSKTYDLLDKVNALLPTDTFITVMRGLMANHLPSVRRKAMELLNNKLQHHTHWEPQQVTALLQLTDDLLAIVGRAGGGSGSTGSTGSTGGGAEEAEQAINRQTALYSLKLLCRSFGGEHQEAQLPVLAAMLALLEEAQEERNVAGSALLCVAEAVGALRALAIPHLPRLMPALLQAVSRSSRSSCSLYLLSAVTALQRVVHTLPHFISPFLQELTSQVCQVTCLVEASPHSASSSSSQLSSRLCSLRSTLSSQVPPRVLLPPLSRCYSSMVQDRQDQLGALMSILQEHISHMDKEQLSFHQSELTSFFLSALDFRAEHCQDNLERAAAVEASVVDCLVAMVMKLSEVTFRPLFFKLLDWSKAGGERLLTFYFLCERLAERLRGLFVLFAGNLVKPVAELLQRTHTCSPELLFPEEQKNLLLLQRLLSTLTKLFLYDTHNFLSRERADALIGPLLQQVENPLLGPQVSQLLVPCVGQFAVAVADDQQWKKLNYQILLKTRHTESSVRFSSLLLLMELASRLKENYVVLLPETIPFLAELMEDECEEVEQQVQKVVQEMENILGEPLQSYF